MHKLECTLIALAIWLQHAEAAPCNSSQVQAVASRMANRASAGCQTALQSPNITIGTVFTSWRATGVCQSTCQADLQSAVSALPACSDPQVDSTIYTSNLISQVCVAQGLTQNGQTTCTAADLAQITAMQKMNASAECSSTYKPFPANMLTDMPPSNAVEVAQLCASPACRRDLELWSMALPNCTDPTSSPANLRQGVLASLGQWCAQRPPLTRNGSPCTPFDGGYMDLVNQEYLVWPNCSAQVPGLTTQSKLFEIIDAKSNMTATFCSVPACQANALAWSSQMLNCTDSGGNNMQNQARLKFGNYCSTPPPPTTTPSPTSQAHHVNIVLQLTAVVALVLVLS